MKSGVLAQVFAALKAGTATDQLAMRLGLDDGIVAAAVDHFVALKMVTPAGELAVGCVDCSPNSAADLPPSCFGCPITGRRAKRN
jgi:hypothetical protein